MSRLTNIVIRRPVVDGFIRNIEPSRSFEEIRKAVVKEHARATKTGKVSNVKQYQDKRTKKQQDGKKENSQSQNGNGGDQGGNQSTAEIDKKIQHMDFMMKNYQHILDPQKFLTYYQELHKQKRVIEDAVNATKPHAQVGNEEKVGPTWGKGERSSLKRKRDRERQKKLVKAVDTSYIDGKIASAKDELMKASETGNRSKSRELLHFITKLELARDLKIRRGK